MDCWEREGCEWECEREIEWEACDEEGEVGDGGGGEEAVVVMMGCE